MSQQQGMGACGFSCLPTEMKENIFAFIRYTRDRRVVRLVCRDWNDTSMPIFYQKFMTETQVSRLKGRESFDGYNCSKSVVLTFVRHLFIAHDVENYTLNGLIVALPENVLRYFDSHAAIDTQTFMLLLQRQQQLHGIGIFAKTTLDDISRGGTAPMDPKWMAPYLAKLERMQILPANNPTAEYIRFIIRNSPRIREVYIYGCMGTNALRFLQSPTDTSRSFSLTHLHLEQFDFSNFPTTTMKLFNVKTLIELKLFTNYSTAAFYRAVADSISAPGSHGPSLKRMEVIFSRDEKNPEDSIGALEELLVSFHGLSHLLIDTGFYRPVDKAFVQNHGASLQYLFLDFGRGFSPEHYPLADIRAILATCDHLETLTIMLPQAQLGKIQQPNGNPRELPEWTSWTKDWQRVRHLVPVEQWRRKDRKKRNKHTVHYLRLDFRLRVSGSFTPMSELEAFLEAIATHPTLRGLRSLSMPSVEYGNHYANIPQKLMEPTGVIMKHYANEIIKYLARHGSGIKLFCMGPIAPKWKPRWPDQDGHLWPDYYYLRSQCVDSSGKEYTRALPLPNVEAEMPDLEFMFYKWCKCGTTA